MSPPTKGYGPGGVAIFVDAATNNQNRTVGNVRSYFSKCEGNLGASGSLGRMFERKAEFVVELSSLGPRPDEVEMEMIDGGADDVVREGRLRDLPPFQSFRTDAGEARCPGRGGEERRAEALRPEHRADRWRRPGR